MIAVNWKPDSRELRHFAIISLFGFPLAGLMPSGWADSASVLIALCAVGVVNFLVGIVPPRTVRVVYVIITAVTLPLGWLLSKVVLRLMFYCVLTPPALFFKLIGRDALQLRRRASSRTYWQACRQSGDLLSYYRQT